LPASLKDWALYPVAPDSFGRLILSFAVEIWVTALVQIFGLISKIQRSESHGRYHPLLGKPEKFSQFAKAQFFDHGVLISICV